MPAPEELTIAAYPWPTIDANDLLHRMAAADKTLEDARAMAQTIIDEHLARIAELEDVGIPDLDYNDQGDLAFGRIRRLLMKHPECDDVGKLLEVGGEEGLDLDDVGLSGEQVSMAFEQAKAIHELTAAGNELADEGLAVAEGVVSPAAIDEVGAELNAILSEAGIEPRSTVEGVKGGDLVGRVRRLVASRERAIEQHAAAIELVEATLEGKPNADAAAAEAASVARTDEAPA